MPRAIGLMLLLAMPMVSFSAPLELAGVTPQAVATPDQPEFMVGEPGFVSFTVMNPSTQNLLVLVGGDYRNRLGRPNSFQIEVTDAAGVKLPLPDSGFDMGGMTGPRKFPAMGTYVYRLFLPHWASFTKPGTYTMTIRRKLELVPDDGGDAFRPNPHIEPVSAIATIKIVPTDAIKLGKLIDKLGPIMVKRTADNADEAEKIMIAIDDERVIPHFIAMSKIAHSTPRTTACGHLGKFNNDAAFDALKALAKTTGDDVRESATTLELATGSANSVRHSAVYAIANSPHPQAIAQLWTYANDPYFGVRMTVLSKAAESKTITGRAIVDQMTGDVHETVRNEAVRYQKLLAK